jgi:hypothetical protein
LISFIYKSEGSLTAKREMNHSGKSSLKYMIALRNYTNPNNTNSDELKPKMSPLQIQKPFQMQKINH